MGKTKICGVYKISSLTHPDRCYIGSSINIYKRWEKHRKELRENRNNAILQAHYNKYGKDDFVYTIIEQFDFISKDHLISREQFYIDNDPLNGYFNIIKIADSCLGIKHTPEQIERKRAQLKGKKRPPFSEEWLKNMSESHKGLPFIRKPQHYKKGQESTFKGKHHTEESKQKNREKHIGSHDAVMRGIETRRRNGNMMERDEKGHFKKKEK